MCREPLSEHLEKQNETTAPGRPCSVAGVEKPAVEEEHCKEIHAENPPAETRGSGLGKARVSGVTGRIPVSASCRRMHVEVFMEVDVAEKSLVEVHSSASKEWQAESGGLSDVSLDPPPMEVESMKSDSSLNDPVAVCDVLQSGDTNEISAECESPSSTSENSSFPSSIPQLDINPGASSEESCFSLASALKELHKLLIINRQGDCKILTSEEVSQLEVVHKEQANHQGFPQDKHEDVDPASQEQSCSFSTESSEGRNAEQHLGEARCGCGAASACVTSISHTQPAVGQDGTEMQKLSGKSDLLMLNSAVASADQQQSSEQTSISAGCDRNPADLPSEPKASVSSEAPLNKDVSEDPQRSLTAAPGRSSSPAPQGPWPSGFEEPPLHPPAGPSEPPSAAPAPPAFPAADVNRILRAGFAMREALEALQQAEGNADLALLILLAKSIVVPT
ncbi:regulatory solute carrier protein family 1 member 1 [Nothoprocta perdicaria]|nr:regulatory solute carrier protein family 1 member 1 [Nothoprocta perdicaria]